MKKFLCFLLGILAAWIVFQLIYAYANQKSNDNLPAIVSISEMREEEANEILKGYRRSQLNEVWRKPDKIESTTDIWETRQDRFLIVNYDREEKVSYCFFVIDEREKALFYNE